jgi:hypothetical protein
MSQKTSDPAYLGCRNRGKVDSRHRLGGVHSAEYRALAVVVVHALISLFFDLIDRMERWNSRHCEGLSWLGFHEHNATPGERAGSSSTRCATNLCQISTPMRVENNVSNLAVHLRPSSIRADSGLVYS